MQEFIISVGKIEELQMVQDLMELDIIFEKAKRNLIGGGEVVLVRESLGGRQDKFDSFTNVEDLDNYKESVYKYLKK